MRISDRNCDVISDSLYSPLVESAIRLAAQAHYGQFRKREANATAPAEPGSPLPHDHIPYVTHLMATAYILARLGVREEVVAAALLHDYLEDVPDPNGRETIRAVVGAEVLNLVLEVTENKRHEQSASDTWELRKTEQIKAIASMSSDAVMIKAADMLHNLHSLVIDINASGRTESFWDRFHADPERQLWYFGSAIEACRQRLGDHHLINELSQTIGQIRRLVP